ncbi:MAG: archaetidylserine decarboxylase [Gemmataceae bacterium]
MGFRTRIEEYRQACRIHGSVFGFLAVSMALRLVRLPIPSKKLRLGIYRTLYGKKYPALDENELEVPMADFPSVNALFTRGVKPELRPIADATHQFLCPCDGRIQDFGRIENDTILTVKGIEYSVPSLLATKEAASGNGHAPLPSFDRGHFAIIFLSPSDCHRIFAPQAGQLERVEHVPGYRLLVHPPYQRKEFPVFTLNERMVFHLATPLGRCALVMVAGWGVGNITLPIDPDFRPRKRQLSHKTYEPARPLQPGQWLATFELGSTAILITDASLPLRAAIDRDEKVKYGQPLFTRES